MKFSPRAVCVIGGSVLALSGCGGSASNDATPTQTPVPTPTAITVAADFSTWIDNPLIKDKIGVYQTPFMGTAGIAPPTSMQLFLVEAGVRDLQYETAWGKGDAFAYDQIIGTSTAPSINFSFLDSFILMLQANHVQPLLAVGYDPLPLQISCSADCWKQPPSNFAGWSSVLQQFSDHYAHALHISGVQYEIWNEPDIASGGSPMFFTGTKTDYSNLFSSGVAGVQAGTGQGAAGRDALVGGPAIAYDTAWITQTGMLSQSFGLTESGKRLAIKRLIAVQQASRSSSRSLSTKRPRGWDHYRAAGL